MRHQQLQHAVAVDVADRRPDPGVVRPGRVARVEHHDLDVRGVTPYPEEAVGLAVVDDEQLVVAVVVEVGGHHRPGGRRQGQPRGRPVLPPARPGDEQPVRGVGPGQAEAEDAADIDRRRGPRRLVRPEPPGHVLERPVAAVAEEHRRALFVRNEEVGARTEERGGQHAPPAGGVQVEGRGEVEQPAVGGKFDQPQRARAGHREGVPADAPAVEGCDGAAPAGTPRPGEQVFPGAVGVALEEPVRAAGRGDDQFLDAVAVEVAGRNAGRMGSRVGQERRGRVDEPAAGPAEDPVRAAGPGHHERRPAVDEHVRHRHPGMPARRVDGDPPGHVLEHDWRTSGWRWP